MARELAADVWQIPCRGVSAYLVADDVLTLVDAGTPLDAGRIRDGVADAGFALGDVERVVLTHFDLDHAGGLAGLTPDLDAPVFAHEFDGGVLAGTHSTPLGNHKGLLQRVLGAFVRPSGLEVRSVADGDAVGTFTVYHTPGHTPGHLAFVSEQRDTAVLGDLVKGRGGELATFGWLLSYDPAAARESVQDLADRAPPFEVACVGHGDPLAEGGSDALRALAERL